MRLQWPLRPSADAAAVAAAQALTNAASTAAAVAALDFSSYLTDADLSGYIPDLSDYITTSEGDALQAAAELICKPA